MRVLISQSCGVQTIFTNIDDAITELTQIFENALDGDSNTYIVKEMNQQQIEDFYINQVDRILAINGRAKKKDESVERKRDPISHHFICDAVSKEGFTCTLPEFHTGMHVAHNCDGKVLRKWLKRDGEINRL